MPFGLTNAPAVFQHFINGVLGNLLDVCAVGYIDDILIYSDSLETHQDHVREVLRQLQEARLYANPKKCKFHMDTVEYLGFILTPTGLHMDLTKVAAIQGWCHTCDSLTLRICVGPNAHTRDSSTPHIHIGPNAGPTIS